MTQKICIIPQRSNSMIVLSPPPADNSQTVFGPLAAGEAVTVEKGAFLDMDVITIHVWDADDYAASQQLD